MKRLIISLVLLSFAVFLGAQQPGYYDDVSCIDTLPAAIKIDRRRLERELGMVKSDIKDIRTVVAPLGEGDPVKWAQSLPGVAAGADLSSAMYVRGGNMGNNLVTLDGVPVYGYSHLLGVTTVVPQSVIASASMTKGGFDGADGNFTSAHLNIVTRKPESGYRISAAVNSFLAGVNAEVGWKRFSILMSARVSPLKWEYRAIKGIIPSVSTRIKDFEAGIGDIYAKARYSFRDNIYVELSGITSMDNYYVSLDEQSSENFGWKNNLLLFRFHADTQNSSSEISVSYSGLDNFQIQDKLFRGKMNHLSLKSDMAELTYSARRTRYFGEDQLFGISYGAQYRNISFRPGQVGDELGPKTDNTLKSIYFQTLADIPGVLMFKGFLRRNEFDNSDKYFRKESFSKNEAGANLKVNIGKHVAFESTFDKVCQFYHTLEGLPTGWSIDMIVPSGRYVDPEQAIQWSAGFSFSAGRHSLSAVAFGKRMKGLVLFKYTPSLFSGALEQWEFNVDQGNGDSYGGEFLYEYSGKEWYARVAYTISKTSRYGFGSINDGGRFHAKFDRPHILNAQLNWRSFSIALTFQSGNWENGASAKYPMYVVPDGEVEGDYYSSINNYRMPSVFRLDVGYNKSFHTGRFTHDLSLGICNVTNHFNPFVLYYDADTEQWKGLSLLPVMPNFSYRVNF